jgi:hypothetical protein
VQQAERRGSLVAKQTPTNSDDTQAEDEASNDDETTNNSLATDAYFLEDRPRMDLDRLLLHDSAQDLDNDAAGALGTSGAEEDTDACTESEHDDDASSESDASDDVCLSDGPTPAASNDNNAGNKNTNKNKRSKKRAASLSLHSPTANSSAQRKGSTSRGGGDRRRSVPDGSGSRTRRESSAVLSRVRSLLESKAGHDRQMLDDTSEALGTERRRYMALAAENEALRLQVEQQRMAQITTDEHVDTLRHERDAAVAESTTSQRLLQQMRDVCEALKQQVGGLRENQVQVQGTYSEYVVYD